MTRQIRSFSIIFTALLALGAIIYMFAYVAPWPQEISYHHFADTQTLFHISNIYNVLSNITFLMIGILALYKLYITNSLMIIQEIKPLYGLLFFGLILVALGSSYYHLQPDNSTLLWDRLPMGLSFMALFSIVIAEFISLKAAKYLALPLIFLGLFSVLYWYAGEQQGAGDLRLYILVQYLLLAIIPLILLLFKSDFTLQKSYWLLFLFYFLAKVSEHFDQEIYNLLSFVSGHTLKHLFAALALYTLLVMYDKRKHIITT